MQTKTFSPNEIWHENTIIPTQTHGTRIVEIISGAECLKNCDAIFSRNTKFTLGIKTADCAPITFHDGEKFGIAHAGWRGLCDGILDEFCDLFNENANIFVGPFLPRFEIQRDFCFEKIAKKFGEDFFIFENGKIFFEFQKAIAQVLPTAKFDERSTFLEKNLASFRRDGGKKRNLTIIFS